MSLFAEKQAILKFETTSFLIYIYNNVKLIGELKRNNRIQIEGANYYE